jgi:GntR family transcriptional regulator / MocR family aminotransferase
MTSPPLLPVVELAASRAVPLYEQLYLELRRQILGGRLRRGARLASTRDLARHLGVSRFTVVTALERLIAEGYLLTRAGAGTFVAATLPDRAMRVSARRSPTVREHDVAASLSSRGHRLKLLHVTGPRPDEPRAFQPRRAPLDIFPVRAWSALVRRLWKHGGYRQLEYGEPAGERSLREAIAAHVSVTRAVRCDPDQVIVTSGAQQAFDILFRVLLDPGDRAWIEEPGYLDVRAALLAAGAELVPVPLDRHGIIVSEGRRLARSARLAVVSPSHGYPSGVTLSAARRMELIDWACAAGAWIVEDDYDSYFRFAGRPMSALQGLEPAGDAAHVIYVGTFSKTVFPSLRLGFCVVPAPLIEAVTNARAVADRNSPVIDQAALTEFMSSGHYDRHLRRLRVVCQERHEAMHDAFARVFGDSLHLTRMSAGTHVIGRFPREWLAADPGLATRIARLAAEEGVIVFPLSRYCLSPPAQDALVLGFGGLSPRRIATGAEKLSAIMRRARRHGTR